ncbi:PAAR domain-containing protein [Pseudoxanthomonas putridarboris]|uniref:PAAR domain-containing protein n=1 Tax=Pseudoxanthomonas putridarboris TaxID=752605 RepID=A0ABU9J550_9GAMM
MFGFAVVMGDTTDHGGKVLTGYDGAAINGAPVAHVGSAVSCPLHGMTTIVSGQAGWLVEGKPVAAPGDRTSCGATLIAGTQSSVEFVKESASTAASAARGAFLAPAATAVAAGMAGLVRYDEQLRFVTPRGVSLANVHYTLHLEDGGKVEGVTDAEGKTCRIETETPSQVVKAELSAGGSLCCAQHAAQGSDEAEVAALELDGIVTHSADLGVSVRQVEIAKGKSRGLTQGEIGMAQSVFGAAIDYARVKVHHGGYWLFFGRQKEDTAVTPNGEMYWPTGHYKDDFMLEDLDYQKWFIHEMTHVWQYQLGYPVKRVGLRLHAKSGGDDENYRYTLAPDKRLCDFNMEAQGNLLADYYLVAIVGSPKAREQMYEVKYEHTPDIRAMLEQALADFILNPSDRGSLPKTLEASK